MKKILFLLIVMIVPVLIKAETTNLYGKKWDSEVQFFPLSDKELMSLSRSQTAYMNTFSSSATR